MSTDTVPIATCSTHAFEYQLFPDKVLRVPTDVPKYYETHTIPLDADMNASLLATTMYQVYVASETHLYRIYDDRSLFNGCPQPEVQVWQLGDGSNIKQICGAGAHLLILDANACVWSLGSGTHGELGLGDEMSACSPMSIFGLEDIVQVAAGRFHSVALNSKGAVYAWGWNNFGQLGHSVESSIQREPVLINREDGPAENISATSHSTEIKLKAGGTITYGAEPTDSD